MAPPKRFPKMKPPQRFAVGTAVRVSSPGVDGIVIALDDERSVMSEYWHTVKTKHGERREPGCNLAKIPPPIDSHPVWNGKLADTIHFSGPNSRLNLHSVDHSTNSVSHEHVFSDLRESAAAIEDVAERERILARIADLEAADGTSGFLPAYQTFIGAVADHLTIFATLMPGLTMLLSTH